jgi:hypothetical protein
MVSRTGVSWDASGMVELLFVRAFASDGYTGSGAMFAQTNPAPRRLGPK